MIPDKLKAGGQEFTIEYKEYVAPGKRALVTYSQTRIDIKSDRDIQTQAEAIFHEVLHIAEKFSNLNLEEKFIQTVARQWFGILRDNPDLFNQDVVRVCGWDYRVVYADVIDKDADEDLGSQTVHEQHEFRIADDLSPDAKELYLMYCIFNAIEAVLDISVEQDIGERLSHWLHAIFKDNPQIWPHRMIEE